jgi:hypothetical protein
MEMASTSRRVWKLLPGQAESACPEPCSTRSTVRCRYRCGSPESGRSGILPGWCACNHAELDASQSTGRLRRPVFFVMATISTMAAAIGIAAV